MKFYVPVTVYAWIDFEEEADDYLEAKRKAMQRVSEMSDEEFNAKLHVNDIFVDDD